MAIPDAQPTTEAAVFRMKARQAAQQCLYFLYFLESRRDNGEVEPGGGERRGALTDRVLESLGWALDGRMIEAYRTFAHAQMRALVGVVRTPRDEQGDGHGDPVVERWDALCELVAVERFGRDAVRPAIEAAQALLAASEPRGPIEGFNQTVRKVLLAMLRNLTLLLAMVAVWAVFFKVEAVRSLVWNRAHGLTHAGLRVVLASWSPFLAVLLSVALMVLAAPRRRARFGKRAFWAFKYQALQPEPGIARWPPGPRVIQQALFGRQLVKLSVAVAVLGLEALVMSLIGAPTTLTIFIVATLALLALVLAHALDYWDFIDAAPLRFLALVTLAALFGFSTDSAFYRAVIVCGMGALAAQNLWAWRRRQPRRPIRGLLAALFAVAAIVVAGNLVSSIVAFLFTMTGLAIWRWRVVLDGDKRTIANYALAAICTYWTFFPLKAELEERRGVWRENVQAIQRIPSGEWPLPGDGAPVVIVAASGGGSRAAIYTAYTLERLHRDTPEVADHLQAISSVSGGSLASAAYVARRLNLGKHFPAWVGRLPAGVEPGELVAAMSEDFLLPTIVGALSPLSSRGDSIEAKWRDGGARLRDDRAGDAADLGMSRLAAAWHDAYTRRDRLPPFPVPLFNACTLDQHDVVISPLAAELYTRHDGTIPDRLYTAAALGSSDWLTWVADRDAIYGLDKLLPRFDPSLPKAVRASANFPFGFPLVALDTRPGTNRFADPTNKGRGDIKLTDGGVLSNSGMWPVFPLLTDDRSLAELRRRGVMLIIVEASKMPEYMADRRDLTTLYGDLNNRNPIAQALHRRMIEGLRARLEGGVAVIQIDITPRAGVRSANVLTTWVLDPASQASLKESFHAAWARQQPRIVAAWDCLKRTGSARAACLDASARGAADDPVALRPPLD
jgi:hypothetical protein